MDIIYYYLRLFTDPIVIPLILITAGLWILRDLRKHHHKRLGWWLLLSSLLCLYLLSISPVVSCLAYVLEKDYRLQRHDKTRKIDVVVVLGGGVSKRGLQSDLSPSKEMSSRLLFGLQTLKRSNAKFIVFCGGGEGDISEAETMFRVAKNLGIEESKIIVESKSQNTWEHAVELDKLLTNKNMTIGIVTSALHMKRSLMVFKNYFPNVVPLPSSYLYSPKELSVRAFLPKSYRLYASSTIFHEIIGLLWYSIRV